MQKPGNGLRSEILLTLAILFGSALLLGGFLFLRYAEQTLLLQRVQKTTLGMKLIAQSLEGQSLTRGTAKPGILFKLEEELGAHSWWMFDRNLEPNFNYTTVDDSAPPPRGLLHQVMLDRTEHFELEWPGLLSFLRPDQQSSLLVVVPLAPAQRASGVLAARFPLEDILDQLITAQRWLLLYVLAFGAVLVGAGLYLLNRNIVRPTQKLLEATRNVASGNLDIQLEQSGPREIYALAESFNQMAASLSSSRDETRNHIRSLNQAHSKLQQTQNQLIRSEKLATLGHIAAGMAHEIGNPLGALTGYLALLEQDLRQSPQQPLLHEATLAAERIDHLVQELLDYAAPSDGNLEIFDPWIAVKEAARLLELQGALKNCALKLADDLTLPPVRMNRTKLEQVLINLLINGRDACAGPGQLTIRGESHSQRVRISIEDNGCGIAPDRLGRIFEPFYSTKAPGKGRGLGLAVCQRIMNEAQAEITCTSQPGKGSTFCLEIPRAESNSRSANLAQ